MGSTVICSCLSSNVRRSLTRWYDWPLNIAFVPFRCRRCRLRFWRLRLGLRTKLNMGAAG